MSVRTELILANAILDLENMAAEKQSTLGPVERFELKRIAQELRSVRADLALTELTRLSEEMGGYKEVK
jgi:hypothetical protein